MKRLKYIVPNAITMLNLLGGILAIVFLLEGHVWEPVFFMLIAAVADLLDGLTAKLLKATSEFGKQLDSLADLVSFGVAPSIMAYTLLLSSSANIKYVSFALAVFSALRLARFNVQTNLGSNFKGMPVPASALCIVSIWIVAHGDYAEAAPVILNTWFLLGVVAMLSVLMVSNISMLSLKFEGFGMGLNVWRYVLILGGAVLFAIFGRSSLMFIMAYYIGLSVIRAVIVR